jgi:hypothetical protein
MKSAEPNPPPYVPRRKGKGYRLGPREAKPIPAAARWITGVQVRARYGGRSNMWLWRKVHNDPNFPKPSYDGRLQIFQVADLDEYDRLLIANRVGGEPRPANAALKQRRQAARVTP